MMAVSNQPERNTMIEFTMLEDYFDDIPEYDPSGPCEDDVEAWT